MINSLFGLVLGQWSWMEETNMWRRWRRKPKRTTSNNVQGNLAKQDRNKHQHRRLLLQRLRCHIICVCGLTWKQVLTTRVVSKCQKRWSDCFDTILQYFEKKTEQSNSESWHRCFFQNLRLPSIGQFEHGLNYLQRGGGPKKRFQYCLNLNSAETIFITLEENNLILNCKTTCCYRATSPSTSITLEAPTTCTPSSN